MLKKKKWFKLFYQHLIHHLPDDGLFLEEFNLFGRDCYKKHLSPVEAADLFLEIGEDLTDINICFSNYELTDKGLAYLKKQGL